MLPHFVSIPTMYTYMFLTSLMTFFYVANFASLIGFSLFPCSVMASRLIVVHGGSWWNNMYKGRTNEYIPMPPSGISYRDLLTKLEVRLKKDKSGYTFDIYALVEVDEGKIIRMNVNDEFEWSSLKAMTGLPIIYLNASPKCKACSSPLTNAIVPVDALALPIPNTLYESNLSQGATFIASQQSLIEHGAIPIHVEPIATGQLQRGSVFMSKDLMLSAVYAYHLKNFADFRTKVSDSRRLHIVKV